MISIKNLRIKIIKRYLVWLLRSVPSSKVLDILNMMFYKDPFWALKVGYLESVVLIVWQGPINLCKLYVIICCLNFFSRSSLQMSLQQMLNWKIFYLVKILMYHHWFSILGMFGKKKLIFKVWYIPVVGQQMVKRTNS